MPYEAILQLRAQPDGTMRLRVLSERSDGVKRRSTVALPALSMAASSEQFDETGAACLSQLLRQQIGLNRQSELRLVSAWLSEALEQRADNDRRRHRCDQQLSHRVLAEHGLRLVDAGSAPCIAVANYHHALMQLFNGTSWAARVGSCGVWRSALLTVPGARRGGAFWFGGVVARSVLIPAEPTLADAISSLRQSA